MRAIARLTGMIETAGELDGRCRIHVDPGEESPNSEGQCAG